MALRSHRVVLVLVALLPVVVFALVVVALLATQERAGTDRAQRVTARAVTASVDSVIHDVITTLAALATAEQLEAGDLPGFHRLCARARPSQPGWSSVTLVDPSGRVALSTRRPFGAPLPAAGDRDLLRRAADTGRPTVSGHVVDAISGEPQVVVAMPVRQHDAVRWVLVASLHLDPLAAILAEQRTPAGWSTSILDAGGVVLAHAPDGAALVGRRAAAPPPVPAPGARDDAVRIRTPAGVTHTVFARSHVTDWTVAVALPAALMQASTLRSLGTVLAGGAFFTLVGVALATLLGRRIAAPIAGLARVAQRHGGDAPAGAQRLFEQDARAATEAARLRAAFLADASRLLASSLDYEATLASVARLAVPQLADLCTVDVVGEDDALRRLTTVADDPAAATGASAGPADDAHPMARALATGRPALSVPVGAGSPAPAGVWWLVVPLLARGRTLGAISFGAAGGRRRYTDADVPLAEDLARRAAAAVDIARLFRESETRRRAAEALAQAGRFLGEALDPAVVAERIATSARTLLGLPSAVLYAVDPQTLDMRVVATSGADGPGLAPDLVLPAGAGTVGLAVRERRPVATTDAVHDALQHTPPPRPAARERAPQRSVLAVPMLAQGRVVGVLALGDHLARVFAEEEILFAQGFADQAALAVENARLLAEAQEANRAKDEFLATLSHELRTPLTATLGWIRMLQSGRLDESTGARAIQVIDRNTKLQAQLIDDLLDVSRIVTGKLSLDLRPVNLVGVIESARETVDQGAQAKGVQLLTRLDPAAGPVWGDVHRLQQVVWNLLSNAIKFTPAGGRVEVRLERAGPHVRIHVRDTGHGISPQFLPHMFDRFRQADGSSTRPHGGLGVGLAIVRDLVQLHRGSVRAESEGEGRGATFVVELPVMAVRVPEPEPAPAGQPAPPGPSIERFPLLTGVRVLVVDDDADARDLVAAVLEQSGAEVTRAASASEALDALARVRPSVLVSDISMPDEDGYALVRKVRDLGLDRGGRVRAVALSAYARAEDRARALEAGFETHIPKPVEPAVLINIVAGLAGRDQTP